jgi:hypothetical protein
MALLSDREVHRHQAGDDMSDRQAKPRRCGAKLDTTTETTPRRTVCKFQSQSHLTSDQKRRRHFSFEPGEDLLQALKVLTANDDSGVYKTPSKSSDPLANGSHADADIEPLRGSLIQNASMIPSPVQVYGSVRREGSVSSLQSAKTRAGDGRHNSRSSTLTAFRDNPGMNLRPASSSRSSSFKHLRSAETSPSSKDRPNSGIVLNGVAVLSADYVNSTAVSQGGSPGGYMKPTMTSSLRANRTIRPLTQENDEPSKSG